MSDDVIRCETEPPTLPYGRYAGQPLERVPPIRLHWALACGGIDAELRAAIEQELKQR